MYLQNPFRKTLTSHSKREIARKRFMVLFLLSKGLSQYIDLDLQI